MKLSKFDIGAEIISILTKGMYQDPRDALREYIQNAVDANSKNINVKIRQNTIVVDDDGFGMSHDVLRKAIRIGVSDKKPGKDVGFMGIGIYSAYHLCEKLIIFSKAKGNLPCQLKMNFQGMKNDLASQKELRLNDKLSGDELIDLQTLLENHIILSDENTLADNEFPEVGTRVELMGVEPNFYKELNDFDFVAGYLKDAIPLHFDYKQFEWGKEIEEKISKICKEHNAKFELVNVKLQVNNKIEDLYKPYYDTDFHNNKSQTPVYQELKEGKIFIGVVWGCLNSTRNKIKEKKLRGFLIRKQGFAIGRREQVVKYFNSHTHFDRYIGEIIVVNPKLLPNASRDDFEFTNLRTIFYDLLVKAGSIYNQTSNNFQNSTSAIDKINTITKDVKKINAEFTGFEKDADKLVEYLVDLNNFANDVESIIRRNVLSDKVAKDDAMNLKESIKELIDNIKDTINKLITEKKRKKSANSAKTQSKKIEIAKNLSSIDTSAIEEKKYDNLLKLLEDLDFELDSDIAEIFNLLDELFIQRVAKTKLEYYEILSDLKEEINNLGI
ncbi:Histidine kinase/HSP90-like domain-containing protein [Desulfonema limicola]|uniref:Histidine kinase/HSP90-like domain-containing protein n=1 Tax=Desulfonema limicola TaxID=45656 RepID=A0A975B634_9BACT|nr:ATP-binding protein [Desulfonema limicola]QTA79432.1 Histidine kinase/HSP90-like domain-containing protein [Desulfonema limicola]